MNIFKQDKCFFSAAVVAVKGSRLLLSGLMWLVLLIMPVHVLHAEEQGEAVKTITVKKLSELIVQNEHSVPATVISLNQPMLSAQISAKVDKIIVDVGDNVKKGSVLLSLDCRDYQNTLQQANASYLARKAQAAFAEKTYKRNKKLVHQSTLPQSALDQAESEYLSIQADLSALNIQRKSAELNVERCQIKAPFSGQITKRQVQRGQLVSPNTPLFELLQTHNLQLSAELTLKQSKQVKQARKILFRAGGQETSVSLYKIVSLVKASTRTQSARFKLPEASALVVGTAGRLVWKSSQPQLQASYISQREGKKGVLTLQENNKRQKIVKFIPLADVQEGQAADIDLPLDTLIVDRGRLTVQDKQVVNVK